VGVGGIGVLVGEGARTAVLVAALAEVPDGEDCCQGKLHAAIIAPMSATAKAFKVRFVIVLRKQGDCRESPRRVPNAVPGSSCPQHCQQ